MSQSLGWFDRVSLLAVRGLISVIMLYATPLRGGESGEVNSGSGEIQDASIEPTLEKVVTEAATGRPLGAGRMVVSFLSGTGPVIYPDQELVLNSNDNRVRYATFNVQYENDPSEAKYQVRSVESLFLLHDDDPAEVTLSGPEGTLASELMTPVLGDMTLVRQLRTKWWEHFSKYPTRCSEPEKQLHRVFVEMLARRHRMRLPNRSGTTSPSAEELTSLESQFERAIGMLFGIESVKLAMQDDVTLRESTVREVANRPVPPRPRMSSLAVPQYDPVPIEDIAMRVPEECFYLRTKSFSNYLVFRDFLTGWGGSLDDIVSPKNFDWGTRRRIENQLGIDLQQLDARRWDRLVSDVALIGCDPLFRQGASVGILMETQDHQSLTAEIQRQRAHLKNAHADAEETQYKRDGSWVSFIETPDHRVRSFYAMDGRYQFITNSEHLLKRFLQTANGERCLGQLNEFGYARSKSGRHHDTLSFLYLSDPFFQNLISPHYRIEMTRRARAEKELQQLLLATLVARAEREPAGSVKDLVAGRLLPPNFGIRSDGSRAMYRNKQFQDSYRGVRGTFMPVMDVPVRKITASEHNAYRVFIANYNRQWGRIDPVTVVFSNLPDQNQAGLGRFGIEILVAPYARLRYALLNTHLADASMSKLAPLADDRLSVQAAVRLNRSSKPHLLSIGLRDDEVDFSVEDGKVKLLGEDDDSSYAKTRCYAAITPPSTNVLRMLSSVLLKAESPSKTRTRAPAIANAVPSKDKLSPLVPISPLAPAPTQMMYYLAWAFGNMPSGAVAAAKYLPMIETRAGITVVSESGEIRDQVHQKIKEIPSHRPHEIQLRMRSLEGSLVEPYIQAYTYMDALEVSSNQARMLNRMTDWLDLPPQRSREMIETLLDGKVCCPLGGEYELRDQEAHQVWKGTAWTDESRFQVGQIPKDWKSPFLDWLRELQLDFDLGGNTLSAKIEVTARVNHQVDVGDRLVSLDPQDQIALWDKESPDIRKQFKPKMVEGEESNDWILGVRVRSVRDTMKISFVHQGSPAARHDIRVGDIIESVDGEIPTSSDRLIALVRRAQAGGVSVIRLNRNGTRIRLRVTLGD